MKGNISRCSSLQPGRHSAEAAILNGWQEFEDAMRRNERAPHARLSTVIQWFADQHDIEARRIRQILEVRNAVAHRTSRVPMGKLRSSIDHLEELGRIAHGPTK
jgi:hypothetical protein